MMISPEMSHEQHLPNFTIRCSPSVTESFASHNENLDFKLRKSVEGEPFILIQNHVQVVHSFQEISITSVWCPSVIKTGFFNLTRLISVNINFGNLLCR